MSQDEIAVMDGGKCILQLRGARPFFSDNRKYDDMTSRLEGLYDQIDSIEGQIEDLETRILHIKEEKISSDGVYQ